MTKEGRLKQQLLEKWKLEEKCFEEAVMKDLKGKEFKWPRNKPTEQIVFEQNFLDKVLDPDSGHYYPRRTPRTSYNWRREPQAYYQYYNSH